MNHNTALKAANLVKEIEFLTELASLIAGKQKK